MPAATPPAYCITLAQTPGRAARAAAHFAEAGLEARMVRGVHGPSWGLATTLQATPTWRMNSAMVGLNLSHWMVWQFALLSGHEEVLVLEDDCVLAPGFLAELALTRAALPADWQFCHVGSLGLEHRARRQVNGRLVVAEYPFGTHCYLARGTALGYLMETCQEARTHMDQQLYENSLAGRLPHYAAWPPLAGQLSAAGAIPSFSAPDSGP